MLKGQDKSQRENAHTFRKSWRGTWGPLSDGRSKISRRAKEIEEEMVKEYGPTTPRQRRTLRRAAKLEALAEQTADSLGVDPKATKRSLTALERAADAKVAQVRSSGNGQRDVTRSIETIKERYADSKRVP